EDDAQDASDSGRGALIGLDKGGMVVALDLEDDYFAVADIDDPGILARAADDARPRRRQGLQPYLRGFIRAVLAPHRRKDAELGQVRDAAEDRNRAVEFLGAEPVRRRQFRRDVAAASHSLSGARRPARVRPGRPRSKSTAQITAARR